MSSPSEAFNHALASMLVTSVPRTPSAFTMDKEPSSAPLQTNDTSETAGRQGWTPQPAGRGTLDILWSCLATITLSSWSILCLNVQSPQDSRWGVMRRKFYLTLLCALVPELISKLAAGQWLSARRSVRKFHALGYSDWTMRHGFYADMGGLVLQPKDWKSFPIDALQLHYLVAKNYVDYRQVREKLTEDKIRDKNKVDGLLRIITFLQTSWFIVNVCLRAAQGLAICTLELSTAAFLIPGAATLFCWSFKPADVETPEIIYTEATMVEILMKAGDKARKVYSNTPLEFVNRDEWSWTKCWTNGINMGRRFGFQFASPQRPVQRFENTGVWYNFSPKIYLLGILMAACYYAVFISAWNYDFPTVIEKTLWRLASLASMFVLLFHTASARFVFTELPRIKRWARRHKGSKDVETATGTTLKKPSGGLRVLLHSLAAGLRNNTVNRDPELEIPLKMVFSIYFLFLLYCSSRAYIWIYDFLELRSLPQSAYKTVSWNWVIPHVF